MIQKPVSISHISSAHICQRTALTTEQSTFKTSTTRLIGQNEPGIFIVGPESTMSRTPLRAGWLCAHVSVTGCSSPPCISKPLASRTTFFSTCQASWSSKSRTRTVGIRLILPRMRHDAWKHLCCWLERIFPYSGRPFLF